MSCSKYLSCFSSQLHGKRTYIVSRVYAYDLPLCGMNIAFIKMFVFSPTKEIDVSLGDNSLLAKTQVIIFRDMYFLNVQFIAMLTNANKMCYGIHKANKVRWSL